MALTRLAVPDSPHEPRAIRRTAGRGGVQEVDGGCVRGGGHSSSRASALYQDQGATQPIVSAPSCRVKLHRRSQRPCHCISPYHLHFVDFVARETACCKRYGEQRRDCNRHQVPKCPSTGDRRLGLGSKACGKAGRQRLVERWLRRNAWPAEQTREKAGSRGGEKHMFQALARGLGGEKCKQPSACLCGRERRCEMGCECACVYMYSPQLVAE